MLTKELGFRVGGHFGGIEVSPNGVEHEAHDHGIGGAQNADLPADYFVVFAALAGGPEAAPNNQKDEGEHDTKQDYENALSCT